MNSSNALNTLQDILSYWSTAAFDKERSRFYGQIAQDGTVNKAAPLGSVLYARILWTFSAAYQLTKDPVHLAMAQHSLALLMGPFWDDINGGVFWTISKDLEPLDTKKQIYAQAFAIYGLTEYYKIVQDNAVLEKAKSLFNLIEQYSFDPKNGGYLEAFDRRWAIAEDLRLSLKDDNSEKTMNTHLHVLEAYTNLYKVYAAERVATQMNALIALFHTHIVHPDGHLLLFFNTTWESQSTTISFGHDIEASWLILEAAEVLKDEQLIANAKQLALKMAVAAARGIDADGGLSYELDQASGHLNAEKHWWVQAEALVGFYNAWQLSGNALFLNYFNHITTFITKYIIDHKNGEWFWGVNRDHSPMQGEDKVGLWKCPYHNGRSFMELLRRGGG